MTASAGRSRERLRAHYVVERELADRLRRSHSPEERRRLFATMYDELFAKVPDHPRLRARREAAEQRARDVRWNLAQLRRFLTPGCVFMEVGAGDCALAVDVAATAKQVYAVDVSHQHRGRKLPANCQVVISDGRSIPVREGSVDLAFSDQLMEHLHPDDALEQLHNIRRALKPGGTYVCITPNRLYGPNDISRHFDEVPRGFHLKEYSLAELRRTFEEAGFACVQPFIGARGLFMRCPAFALELIEAMLDRLPFRLRRRLAESKPLRAILGVRIAARNP
ncbi:MAG: class I SAM-dependent methyltransferase [Bacillota bacterium]